MLILFQEITTVTRIIKILEEFSLDFNLPALISSNNSANMAAIGTRTFKFIAQAERTGKI